MSKVTFVGNVPYNMSEEALIDVFKTVGEVVGFRLVFDRDTGKPRGYGFCEFADHETAMSAVRNLNGQDCGGRPLRIDLADSDPFLEGKTTVRGEIVDAGDNHRPFVRDGRGDGSRKVDMSFLNHLPPGTPCPPGMKATDTISQVLATMDPQQVIEVLAHTKAFIISHPEHARALLQGQPQFAYALMQAALLHNIVDVQTIQRVLGSSAPSRPPVPPGPPYHQAPPGVAPGPHYGASNLNLGRPTSAASHQAGMYPPQAPPVASHPAPNAPFYRPPNQMGVPPQPAAPSPGPNVSSFDPDQRQMLMQVLTLTPEQIAAMPPTEQETIRMLKSQLMGVA